MTRKVSISLLTVLIIGSANADVCPTGTTAYSGPAVVALRDSNGECGTLCTSGVQTIRTSTGSIFDLFSESNTAPALAVSHNGMVCYADIVSGAGNVGDLKTLIHDVAHHIPVSTGDICPQKYKLTYSCGDGAGTPPDTREIAHGETFSLDYGSSCQRDGWYISSWRIGSTNYNPGSSLVWNTTGDQTATAQWSRVIFGSSYVCNTCEYPFVTRRVDAYSTNMYYGKKSTLTPPCNWWVQCGVPDGATFTGYKVVDPWGNILETVPHGQTFEQKWPYGVMFYAMWDYDPTVKTEHTVSFSCGTDADGNAISGTPPAAQTTVTGRPWSPELAGTCYYPGYTLSSWAADTSNSYSGGYSVSRTGWFPWEENANPTMNAKWTARSFHVAYACNNGSQTTGRHVVTFKKTFTPSTTECTAPEGRTLAGYDVYNVLGEDTGTDIEAGVEITYEWPYNISLYAKWE